MVVLMCCSDAKLVTAASLKQHCWLLQDLALGCQEYITTVVYQHDVIPRASLAGFEALRQEMLATQWEENLTADVSCLLHCTTCASVDKLLRVLAFKMNGKLSQICRPAAHTPCQVCLCVHKLQSCLHLAQHESVMSSCKP